MSSIPNSAMPHAAPTADEAQEGETMTLTRRASEQASRLAGLARDNPRTAIAAGAAVAAGVAAAIPLVRAARRKSNGAAAPKDDAASSRAPARKRATPRKSAKKS